MGKKSNKANNKWIDKNENKGLKESSPRFGYATCWQSWPSTRRGGGPKFFLFWLTFAHSPCNPEQALGGGPCPGACQGFPSLGTTFPNSHTKTYRRNKWKRNKLKCIKSCKILHNHRVLALTAHLADSPGPVLGGGAALSSFYFC